MPEADDLAAIAKALTGYQELGAYRMRAFPYKPNHIYAADAAILALERLRARLANSVPAEQGQLGLD